MLTPLVVGMGLLALWEGAESMWRRWKAREQRLTTERKTTAE